ncbi:cytochrome P450 [Mycobacterium xenopi]|uniref:Cytochrome P450 n=1 Tax=Mycobacterium xenopi TaxID=1789 RepID=A0AAD1GXT4_MYCXE|nr:cytochrome P450 [Mycobacterium xenopi]EUA51310.1 cytochrome P450 family protein [Mycobacterium xenopi 3993]MDA3640570.1 cytochrome P450 [Mycobacterium xenopi]MDA3658018.1 cytochrome P450 [Mycobacterium xenopi]MDA3662600.1 cytochrome P450 [Mycobacterium xenopi]SPX78935.1 cytochrome P450 [Mycobacterium xenopi]
MAPNPDADDIVSKAIGWTIDGAPVSDGDLLSCQLLLFMAGLDTVASQLSYAMLHLATHPADRARIVADRQVIPRAVEELLRVYPIVQTARKPTRDMDFHGCPVKAGDMAAFPMAAAGRDETADPDARRVEFNRGITRHLWSSLRSGIAASPSTRLSSNPLSMAGKFSGWTLSTCVGTVDAQAPAGRSMSIDQPSKIQAAVKPR